MQNFELVSLMMMNQDLLTCWLGSQVINGLQCRSSNRSALYEHGPLAADGVHEDARREAGDEEAEVREGGNPAPHVIRELKVAFFALLPWTEL